MTKRFVTTKVEVEGREETHVVELPSRNPEPWGEDAELHIVGQRVVRMDAIEKVTGDARFTADMQLPGMLYAALLRAVRRVRGVRDVEDLLEVHEQPDVPALQGGTERTGERLDLFQSSWAPATQALVAVAAVGVLATLLRGRALVRSAALASVGSGALLSAAINFGVRSLAEAGLEHVRALGAGSREPHDQRERQEVT